MNQVESAAVIIDRWVLGYSAAPDQYIIDFLNNNLVSTAILASYNCSVEEYTSNNLWYRNERRLFNTFALDSQLKTSYQLEARPPDANPAFYYDNTTIPEMLNYTNANIFQIAMRQPWQIQYYLDQNPQIKNLFVLGGSWDRCMRNRELGYLNLFKMFSPKNIKILTYSQCAGDEHGLIDLDKQSNWDKISENIYQYNPTINIK